LSNNELSGSLPPTLGNLSSLEYIDTSGNQFSGCLPSEVGNLSNLITLYLHSNQFDGALPDEVLNLTLLQWLTISANNFSELADLATHPNKSNLTLHVHTNQLGFEDLEQLFTGPGTHPFEALAYGSQKSFEDVTDVTS